jgi:hypothetical protein
MRTLPASCVLGLVVAGAGCKQASSEPQQAAAAPAAAKPAELSIEVPAALKDKLKFEKRQMKDQFDDVYDVLAPAGWVQVDGFASVHPADEDTWGSSMRFDSDCAGACTAKDWAVVTDKEEFADMREGEIMQDTKTATSRLMIAKNDKVTAVKYAWWTAGASRYSVCSASLKEPYREAAAAFVKACQFATITPRQR